MTTEKDFKKLWERVGAKSLLEASDFITTLKEPWADIRTGKPKRGQEFVKVEMKLMKSDLELDEETGYFTGEATWVIVVHVGNKRHNMKVEYDGETGETELITGRFKGELEGNPIDEEDVMEAILGLVGSSNPMDLKRETIYIVNKR